MNTEAYYSPFRLPVEFWQHSRYYVFLLTLNGLARAAAITGIFYAVRKTVSSLQQAGDSISGSLWVMLLLASALIGLRLHERYTAEKMSQKFVNRLRRRLLTRLMRASIRDVESIPSGALAARLGGDLASLRRWLSLGISRLIVNLVLLLAGIGIISTVNLRGGLVAAVVLFALILVSLRLGEKLRTLLKAVRSSRIRIQSVLVERIEEMAMIRVMGQEWREIRRVNRLGQKLEHQASRQGLLLGGLRGLGEAGGVLLIIAVFAVFQFSRQAMPAADAAAVISLVMFLTSPIRELGHVQEYYRGAAISLGKLSELFNMRRIARGASRYAVKHPKPGTIRFRHVYCAPAVKDFSGMVAAGERVAVVGQNGSGKSTLLQLAVGLLKPDSGTVRLGGVDPRRLSPIDRSNTIGVAGSSFGLLRGKLEFNLKYRRPGMADSELNAAVNRFKLQRLLMKLDRGSSKLIQQGAKNISAGERARISLARATLGNPGILFLDEPECNLDAEGLELLHTLLETWSGTVFLVTHKQSLIDLCHKVWHMDREAGPVVTDNVTNLSSRRAP